jgi:hypothetical protein
LVLVVGSTVVESVVVVGSLVVGSVVVGSLVVGSVVVDSLVVESELVVVSWPAARVGVGLAVPHAVRARVAAAIAATLSFSMVATMPPGGLAAGCRRFNGSLRSEIHGDFQAAAR